MNTVTQRAGRSRAGRPRPQRTLPAWSSLLVVVAHPDDETFGLGAIVDSFTGTGAAVHVVCFSRGEASTLNAAATDLRVAREAEAAFRHASQISPTGVLWRRLQLQGDCEHLRWLIPPGHT